MSRGLAWDVIRHGLEACTTRTTYNSMWRPWSGQLVVWARGGRGGWPRPRRRIEEDRFGALKLLPIGLPGSAFAASASLHLEPKPPADHSKVATSLTMHNNIPGESPGHVGGVTGLGDGQKGKKCDLRKKIVTKVFLSDFLMFTS